MADALSYSKHHNSDADDTNRTEVSKTTFVFEWIMIEVYILARSNNRQNLKTIYLEWCNTTWCVNIYNK